jgi:hypothetical protein
MPPVQRRCSTCRHFQPAPIWRKGWCRNPVLYAPHQNHLVDERDLDCDRRLGDYWEPIEYVGNLTPPAPLAHAASAPPANEAPATDGPDEAEERAASPPPPAETPPVVRVSGRRSATGRQAGPGSLGSGGQPVRQPALAGRLGERIDWLRIGLPALAILVLLIAYLIFANNLFRAAATATPAAENQAVPTGVTSAATPGLTPTVVPTNPPPTAPPLPTAAPTSLAAQPSPAATKPASSPAATVAAGGLRIGGTAVVDTGASNERLRMRREPGRSGVELRLLTNGTRLTIVDGPREIEGQPWWRVQVADEIGWVAGAFIRPVA